MQILFFVCRLSIKAQPFLPSSAPPPCYSSALCWLGTLNVFQVSASYLRAELWQASCPLGPGSLSTPPPPSRVRVLTHALKLGVVCFLPLPSHQCDTYGLSSFWHKTFSTLPAYACLCLLSRNAFGLLAEPVSIGLLAEPVSFGLLAEPVSVAWRKDRETAC